MASRKISRQKDSPHSSTNGAAARTQASTIFEVRDSPVHGRGVYATQLIRKGTRVIEYTGKQMSWADVPNEDNDPHTFIFALNNGKVINAEIGGNEARWINHSCDPNCEASAEDDGIFIYALKQIRAGKELSYDYALEIDEPITQELRDEYTCRCGALGCRGTMLDIKL